MTDDTQKAADSTPASSGSQAADTGASADQPLITASGDEAATTAVEEPPVPPAKKTRRGFPWGKTLLALLLVLVLAALGGLAWFGYQYQQSEHVNRMQLLDQQAQLQQQLQQQAQQIASLKQAQTQALARVQQQGGDVDERLQALEQRVVSQNKRLLAMSTISRDDWLLAEAEYLLKLANQRILIEHSAEGAESLLTEADAILRDLDDPDLFALRKAVNNDLAALRLVQKIDVEGIYLAIDGLINQLTALPLQPSRQEVMGTQESSAAAETVPTGWWLKLKHSFQRFARALGQYIRVRDHSVEAKALLAPDAAQHLLQNLRLILERAQLALLREQPLIYQQSLQQAGGYIERYLPASNAAVRYREQLQALSEREIVTHLPDITPSLELLHGYIEELHQLQGAKPAQGAQP